MQCIKLVLVIIKYVLNEMLLFNIGKFSFKLYKVNFIKYFIILNQCYY